MTYLEKLRSSTGNRWFQRLLRVLQFLSAIISLGIFSSRVAKIIRLGTRYLNSSDGAVEGILAAAALYTLGVMLLTFCIKHGGPTPLRWLLVLMDLQFLGAFIGVAYLTRPRRAAEPDCRNTGAARVLPNSVKKHENCNLPWGTFILAIIST